MTQTSYQPKKTDGISQNPTEECDIFCDCPLISPKGSVTHCCGPKILRRQVEIDCLVIRRFAFLLFGEAP